MKKLLSASIILILVVLVFSQCLFLNKFIKTDAELEEHYKHAGLKPIYKESKLDDRVQHYAVLSKSDTLPLLVLVHGAPGAWYGYMNLTDDSLLQANFKIISVDRLGYGKSGYGKPELSVETQARAIKSIIDNENCSGKKVSLLGRSYGAPITAWLAIHYPQQCEKLLMVSPVIDPQKEKFYWFSSLGKTSLVQWMLPEMLNVATKEKYSHPAEMEKMLPEWKNLCTPTYVLVGENDQIADTANFTFARKNITNCSAVFVKLKQTGHLITLEQPNLIKAMLLEKSACGAGSFMAQRPDAGPITSTVSTEFYRN